MATASRRIGQVDADALELNQGTIYASLVRLQQGKWIDAEWGASENNQGEVLCDHGAGPKSVGR